MLSKTSPNTLTVRNKELQKVAEVFKNIANKITSQGEHYLGA